MSTNTWSRLGSCNSTRDCLRATRVLVRSIFLFALGLAVQIPAYANVPADGPRLPAAPGSQFAVADFDGDLRPDLASIDATDVLSGRTSYRIQLRLSAVGPQSIRLIAPAGGLVIEARDVNGDHAVDLVLSTAWRRQPVAVFLNDGHGSFSRAEPDAFPAAFSDRPTKSYSAANDSIDVLGVLPPSRSGLSIPASLSFDRGPKHRFALPSHSSSFISVLAVSRSSRAPPSAVFCL